MLAFVTGATGFLGSHVARQLLARGAELRLLVRPTSRLDNIADIPSDRVVGDLRDRESLRRSGVPIFARGSTPNGPHKGWGGTINGSVQCGGVSVVPGDLIVGDADGVVAVPRAKLPGLLERCRGRIDREASYLRQIAAGGQTTEILGLSATVEREYEGA